ncbi:MULTISPECIES: phosphorothioated DNA-binding restriction endonuclease [Streptomycetaceae]|uniref:Restriction endonuclease n=1 Tax=Streptantibioticus cattleyicolor (strain ATCC 35852 / DSM 46488 / JCM 4925 / NBRC 14057 / NRRL 8057) TaxID=1003195 RepID=F8K403_STREN|nr:MULTISPECIES: HNH endonuclease [Streptomycetaceae]AEW96192.1 hypothetical protein SCATT_38210 [Streptantibioticus cattleyicolor NRRL 8057 = DSM 46488]MYS60714.1 HNH endonuclease [Streptomyces sp. SID5468]CCB76527.1 conserved protein of unknown function [Streptantibioticus cattleyicolor NRRL 8057 = DSM 46488]
MPTTEEWLDRLGGVRQWSRNGERAAHKPLLLLYALGRYQREGEAAGLRFGEIEGELGRLLRDFGPARPTSATYPFHHLGSDPQVWEVWTNAGPGSPGAGARVLRESGATGRLAPGLRRALAAEPGLLDRAARLLLDANFAPSLHADICEAVGLDLDSAVVRQRGALQAELRRRDPAVRREILESYEYRCAFCGYGGMLDGSAVGVEAAHVRWWAFGGPDEVANGLCLCSLHHKLFDKGVLGLTEELRITVSRRFIARGEVARGQVVALAGRGLWGPQPGSDRVAGAYVQWHTTQVFRGEARTAVNA